jgi:hypothetical protein
MPEHSTKPSLPVNLYDYCTGNGTVEDAAGFQAALNDLPSEGGRLTSPPGKKYRISTPLVQTGKADFQIDMNGSWIESRVASGVVWTVKGGHRGKIISPQFRLMSGAPSAFLRIPSDAVAAEYSWWMTIYEPVFWSHINVPANLDGIVVDDDNYWIEVVRPRMRKLSGTLTGTFRRGVSFLSQSNACKVIGGSINNADTGVHIDSCNSSEVDGTAFEFCTRAVNLTDAGGTPCAGTTVHHIRTEACPIAVDLSGHTDRSFQSPIQIGDIANQDGEATRGHEVWNPNNVPVTRKTGEYISLDTSWAPMKTGLKIKASDNQGLLPLVELEQRDITNPVTSLTADPGTGGTTLNVVSTTVPFAFTAAPSPAGILLIDGVTAAGVRTYEFVSYTGTTETTFTGVVRGLGGSVAQAHGIGSFVRASFNRTFAIDNNGVPMMRSASAAPPTPADDRLILHHRAFVSKLIAWRPDGTGSNLRLSVAGASGTVVDVLSVFEASMRPGVTNTIDLGVTGTRWRNLYLSGVLDHSGASAGFFGATPAAKPTITGSRAGNAALADLLTSLATLGLITDSTTA